ncbi:UNVERIFIED_CONTAM: hypothetical protein GTU68_056371 [Idotea baltica]|nr:hypothetical protein [Idotea baltica]
MLDEAVSGLEIAKGGRYIDGTFGRGGHSRLILQKIDESGCLLGFDKDPVAIVEGQGLACNDSRFNIVQRSFSKLKQECVARKLDGKIDGVLFDLGVSSPQLDNAERGFSFSHDGPLDMRMDPSVGLSAAQWIAEAEEIEIARVFKEYGEERFAKRMARAVALRRETQPFERTLDLAKVLTDANPAWEKNKHPATRAFQGLRIYINNELGDLEEGLNQALEVLAIGGRLVIISFHSLEDRIVKQFMRRHEIFEPKLKLIGKIQKASDSEVLNNPRSRSAVMRVAEKLK